MFAVSIPRPRKQGSKLKGVKKSMMGAVALSSAIIAAACSSNEAATPAPVESELAADPVGEFADEPVVESEIDSNDAASDANGVSTGNIDVAAAGQGDEEPQMSFGECLGDEEMCWEWTSEAENSPDCGPSNDHDYCWQYKVYKPFVSLDPEDPSTSPIDADAQSRAQRLVDLGWNSTVDSEATYFATSDLRESDLEIVRAGIRAAEQYLGTYGPMRVYVIGSDEEVTEPAIDDYCAWAYNPDLEEHCRSDQGVAIWEIAHYQGANAFAQHSRSRSTPTQSFVIGNPAQLGAADGAKIAAHEYVHVYQAAHQLYERADEYGLDMPRWLEEGAAEFLALYLADQNGWLSFTERMEEALDGALDLRTTVPNLTIADIADDRQLERVNDYCGLCFGVLQYETGQWATAWLANKTSVDEVFHGFFPRTYEHGLDRAFELSFGLSIDEFMVQFEDFLQLPRSQQTAILPTP
jgi:hypothetical protein